MKQAKGFTGKENHNITQAEVVEFTKNFQNLFASNSAPGGFFDKAAVTALIQQENAVGMRYYYGVDQDNKTGLLLSGTDCNRNDLVDGEPVKRSILNPPLAKEGTYNPNAVDHKVSTELAAELTANYREQNDSGQPIGGFFGKQAVLRVINQKNCIGLRFYYGADENGIRVICLMGVDQNGKDMFDGYLAEMSSWCPPYCGVLNFLNSNVFSTVEILS